MTLKQNELVKDFTFQDLLKAYYDCKKHKRMTSSALKFELKLEYNLLRLYKELKTGKYKIGRCICFVVTSPKPREVWAANFRDRIVHHLVYNAIKDRFYKRFIRDTYSCIPKRGTLAAAKQMLKYSRSATNNYKKRAYYLKADLSNFFVSIDKEILYNLLEKYIEEDWILKLLKKIIWHNPKNNVFIKSGRKKFKMLPKHKSLWNTTDTKGLPIGNLTSQFFSNVYLDVLDKFVKNELKCKYYCRYVDDFVILHTSPKILLKFLNEIDDNINNNLKLKLNRKKCSVNLIVKGIDFVGYIIKPSRMFLRQKLIKKIFLIIKLWKKNLNKYMYIYLSDFRKTINSYFGMMIHMNMFNIRFQIGYLTRCLFITFDEMYTKAII